MKKVLEMHFPAIWRPKNEKNNKLSNTKAAQSWGENVSRQKGLDKRLVMSKASE